MTGRRLTHYRELLAKILRNPHFWIVIAISVALIMVYQAWPWREWRFSTGAWRYFSWLSALEYLVIDVELKYNVIGVLFFVPIIYGSVTLSWPGGIFAWLLALIWVLPTLVAWSRETMVINLALLLLPALLVVVVALERRWRDIEKRHYAEREQERQMYIARLVEAQENERRRIAQEIHDETLQTLMVVANKSDSLASSSTDDQQMRGNLWIKKEVVQTMDDLRRLSMNLRPSILDNFGLVSGIRWLVNNSNTQSDCRIDVSFEGEEPDMSSLAQVTVFRVVQEAIHNIQRHARARRGAVVVGFEAACLSLAITDDGVGFDPPERLVHLAGEGRLGLIGIEQRVLSAGGIVVVDSRPGGGTRLSARIPYEPPALVEESAGQPSRQSRSSRVRMPDFRLTKIASVLERTFSFWNTPTK